MSDNRFVEPFAVTFSSPSPCGRCANKHLNAATCTAYPQGIPAVFLTGKNDHTQEVPGDNGIRFEAVE